MDDDVRALRRALEQTPDDATSRDAFARALRRSGVDGWVAALYEAGATARPSELEAVARSDESALIVGGSVEARRDAARALHEGGPRRDRPLVEVDVRASSETLLEAELFGHVKRTFRGGQVERAGLLELAAQQTIFLANVEDTPARIQRLLVRALDGRWHRIGEPQESRRFEVRLLGGSTIVNGLLVERLRVRTVRLSAQ
jgi:DNA-binding NtrC family response regulator